MYLKITIKFLILFLFFSLPLVNSHLLDLFGINFNIFVNGNYEFTKVMFFNVCSSIIIFLLFIEKMFYPSPGYQGEVRRGLNLKQINIPYLPFLIFLSLTLILSTLLSLSPFTSLFGNSEKAHSIIMFLNLIGILIVLYNQKKEFLKKTLLVAIYSSLIVAIIGIWQYYYPSFDYGPLSNRAISTFGHPNYLALYILLIIPLTFEKIVAIPSPLGVGLGRGLIKVIISSTLILTLFLTKSVWGIFLFLSYLIYKFLAKYKFKNIHKNYIFILLNITIITLAIFFISKHYPEKLQSFISRLYIWETTLSIIFSKFVAIPSPLGGEIGRGFFDFKTLIFGSGAETLKLIFDSFKSPNLYIFENIGFTADRPHNLILNFFYHFGLLGLIGIIIIIYKTILLALKGKKVYLEFIILFFLFTLLNFPSISTYLLLIIIIAIITKNKKKYTIQSKAFGFILFIIIFISSIIGMVYSTKFYIAENYAYNGNIEKAVKIFPYNPKYHYDLGDYNKGLKIEKFKSEKYYKTKIYSVNNLIKNCELLTNSFPSVENFFFCGKILEKFDYKKESLEFYKKGLEKLPDLWNEKSKYRDSFLIKKTINGNRFFSEKYSDIKNILEKTKN